MKTFARIENAVVVELLATAEPIGTLFHPSLHWVDVTGTQVQIGWVQGNNGTLAPPPPAATATVAPEATAVEAAAAVAPEAPAAEPAAATALVPPSLNELLTEIATLRAQVGRLHIS